MIRLTRVAVDRLRSLAGVELVPAAGITAVVGPNGAGKTNLIEGIYFALTTRSFRTSDRRDLIPFGSDWARARVEVADDADGAPVRHEFMAAVDRAAGVRLSLDGAPVDRVEARRFRPAITVFAPDRLDLVKGPPAGRRTHLDGFIAARWPRLAGERHAYGQALAQRNALLSRLSAGFGDGSQLPAWDARVAATGAALAASRLTAVESLRGHWVEVGSELGLGDQLDLTYRPGGPVEADELERELAGRHRQDIERGRTGIGPHHDEIRLEYRGRQLRRFGSQGQQRVGLLALLFAERESLLESGRPVPLMLLDDVMSELDGTRRELLVERLATRGQAVITAAAGELVPEHAALERVAMADLVAAAAAEATDA